MKFLIDQCLSPTLAESESRVLVSADSDFGEILTIGTKRNLSLILFRGEFEPRSQEQASLLLSSLPQLSDLLEKGSIVVITQSRLRVRELQ